MSQKICVYAICKNELKFVEQWLKNMSEADYIVVLDTGSTDGTYEKLKEDPRVTLVKQQEIKPWRFDVARNESMKLIPDDADILVCTDFDELFEPGWAQFLRDNWIPGYHNRCRYSYAWDHGDTGESQFVFTYDKIHGKNYKWKFPVHEVVWPDGFEEIVLEANNNIFLHHWQDKTKQRGQYLELLELAVKENPKSSHIKLLHAREFLVYERWEEGLQHLFQTLEVEDIEYADNGLVLLQTLDYIAQSYYQLKNYDEALWYCQEFIRVNPTYREPYFLMALIYNETKVYTMAEAAVLAGLKYSTYKSNWVESRDSWYLQDKLLLGAIYLNLQNYTEAEKNIKEALQYKPNNVELLKQYIICLEHKLNV